MGVLRVLKEVMWGAPDKDDYVFAYADNPTIAELRESNSRLAYAAGHYDQNSLTASEKQNPFKTTKKISNTNTIKGKNKENKENKKDKEIEH